MKGSPDFKQRLIWSLLKTSLEIVASSRVDAKQQLRSGGWLQWMLLKSLMIDFISCAKFIWNSRLWRGCLTLEVPNTRRVVWCAVNLHALLLNYLQISVITPNEKKMAKPQAIFSSVAWWRKILLSFGRVPPPLFFAWQGNTAPSLTLSEWISFTALPLIILRQSWGFCDPLQLQIHFCHNINHQGAELGLASSWTKESIVFHPDNLSLIFVTLRVQWVDYRHCCKLFQLTVSISAEIFCSNI